VLGCTPGHIPRYMGRTSNNNKRCQLCICCLLCPLAFIRIYIRFSIYDHYYIILAYILLYHLCSIPPVPALILSYQEYFLLDITCYISTCFYMLVLRTRFSMHDYDSILSIHVFLSLNAIWHSHHHSWGSSDSPGSSCPDPEAWSV